MSYALFLAMSISVGQRYEEEATNHVNLEVDVPMQSHPMVWLHEGDGTPMNHLQNRDEV